MDQHDKYASSDDATTMGAIGQTAQIVGLQLSAQQSHLRREAMQYALGAASGRPKEVSSLIADADAILAWLNKDAVRVPFG